MVELTDRELLILRTIAAFTRRDGFPPEHADLRKRCHDPTDAMADFGVSDFLDRLYGGGFLKNIPGMDYRIALTDAGYAAIGMFSPDKFEQIMEYHWVRYDKDGHRRSPPFPCEVDGHIRGEEAALILVDRHLAAVAALPTLD